MTIRTIWWMPAALAALFFAVPALTGDREGEGDARRKEGGERREGGDRRAAGAFRGTEWRRAVEGLDRLAVSREQRERINSLMTAAMKNAIENVLTAGQREQLKRFVQAPKGEGERGREGAAPRREGEGDRGREGERKGGDAVKREREGGGER